MDEPRISSSPARCAQCSTKSCKQSQPKTLDICEYGVSYYNDGSIILRKEEVVTLRHISQNLRHEVNKVLQKILIDAEEVDSQVSVRSINMQSPASRIVGATVIIDQFIEMISGVNDFHPAKKYSGNLERRQNLLSIINKYRDVHSLIENTRRAKNLKFHIGCHASVDVSFASKIVEYIISIMIDNIWKYALPESDVFISLNKSAKDPQYVDIEFRNSSRIILQPDVIFEKGHQQNSASEGFGYGLYWAKMLASHYNELSRRQVSLFDITHSQNIVDPLIAEQIFIIRNLRT
jgi:hypothetical protein